ncbi:MAG: AAA family ATPase [Myxococcota bacterium]|jgi:energy-coupling factor transporter ATP-binding protein EcfA2|nr:AAA family ATPase [Myxococcota bacterium]
MRIRSVQINDFGPFRNAMLELEDDLTVLTGANDSGKTSILRFLRLAGGDGSLEQTQIQDTSARVTRGPWQNHPTVGGVFSGTLTASIKLPDGVLAANTWVDVERRLAPRVKSRRLVNEQSDFPQALFQVVDLDAIQPFPSEIKLDQPGPAKSLLRVADFDLLQYREASTIRRDELLRVANTGLASWFSGLFPLAPYSLMLQALSSDAGSLAIRLVDRFGGEQTIEQRGQGVRKLVAVLVKLAALRSRGQSDILILADEPENHLHPGFQHQYCRILQELASEPWIQCVYATHSPSMLPLPDTRHLRLVQQTEDVNGAVSEIINRPVIDDLSLLRTALGVCPFDALALAPITLIVEGQTETECLPQLLEKLAKAEQDPFTSYLAQRPQISLVGASRKGFETTYKVVEALGSHAIVMVDADKRQELTNSKVIPNDHWFALEGEFEELVTTQVYFQALERHYPQETQEGEEALHAFLAQRPPGSSYTAGIEGWLKKNGAKGLSKPRVMSSAIELARIEDLQPSSLAPLVTMLNRALDRFV